MSLLPRVVTAVTVAFTAQAVEWPACVEESVALRHSSGGRALFGDMAAFGASTGCYLDDCHNTDKFAAHSMEQCARICYSIDECQWWMFGAEDHLSKCWMRVGDEGREQDGRFAIAHKLCTPPDSKPMVMGNAECWVESFDYQTCCSPQHGPQGNNQCWDGIFNFHRCCFPMDEL